MTTPKHIRHLQALAVLVVLLWVVRSLFASSFAHYGYVGWNMILAAAPVGLVYVYRLVGVRYRKRPAARTIASWFVGAAWLLLLPNTFYLVTDFMHLNGDVLVNQRAEGYTDAYAYTRGDALFILDSVMLFCLTLFGALSGGYCLYAFQQTLRRYSWFIRRVSLGVLFLLVGVGVFIGRYGRWNSWDAITRPWQIIADIVSFNSTDLERLGIIVAAIGVFQLVSLGLVAELYERD